MRTAPPLAPLVIAALLPILAGGCRAEPRKAPIASAGSSEAAASEARLRAMDAVREPMMGSVIPLKPIEGAGERLELIEVVVRPDDRESRKALVPYYQDEEIIFGKRIRRDDGTVLYRFYRPVKKRAD